MIDPLTQNDQVTPLISEVFSIESITWGNSDKEYIVRYGGQLTIDSMAAYDQLETSLEKFKMAPLFRRENDEDVIILIPELPQSPPSNPWINLGLLLLTILSTLLIGASYNYQGDAVSYSSYYLDLFRNLASGLPYGGAIMGILLAHEFGHYFAGRYHKAKVTLPYFIPLPFPGSFGTMGAFIRLKAPPKNKRILHDIGVAGPLAGLVVAIPILLIGLSQSEIHRLPLYIQEGSGLSLEGNSIFYLMAKYMVHGRWLPEPAFFNGTSPFIYWVKYLFTGYPTPLGGYDVQLNSLAWAGWAGLLVTALNLIPAGQLDGGHMLYVLFGKKAGKILPFLFVVLVLLGFVWPGWWLWLFLIYSFGRAHATPMDEITKLNKSRKIISVFALFLFIILFTPIPLRIIMGPYLGP